MRKLKLLLLFCLMLVFVAVISGCGGNHFEGKWVGVTKDNFGKKAVVTFDIQKNGEGYIVNNKVYLVPTLFGDENVKSGGKISKKWNVNNFISNKGGTVKDNILTIGGGRTITYDENTKKLHVPGNDLYTDVTLEHYDDNKKLEEVKKQVVEEIQKDLQEKYPGISYQLID